MSGDHNQHQKSKSYVDDFECPRCGHCCQADQPAQQEPIAWMHTTGTGHVYFRKKPQDKVFNPQPVYTVPPRREWVGLTDEEVVGIGNASGLKAKPTSTGIIIHPDGIKNFFQAIEAKLKEKNNG